MQVAGIGIDLNDERVNGSLRRLEEELEDFQRYGFDTLELTTSGLYFIFHGRLDRERTAALCRLLSRYRLNYTLHLPDSLNLCRSPDPELDERIFSACLEFAEEVGARVVVYHSGLEYYGLDSEASRREALARESEALLRLASRARTAGAVIAVENTNPHAEELELIGTRRLKPEQVRALHPSLCLRAVAEQIERIGASNVVVALDPGHLNLAVEVTGERLLEAVESNARSIGHLHLNDNFGRNPPPARRCSRMEQVLYGLGDCHLPPGMGAIPLREVMGSLPDFKGFVILEIAAQYRDYLPACPAAVRAYLASPGG